MGAVAGEVHPLSRADLSAALAGIGCRSGCPLGTDAGRYARAIARGELELAMRIARRENPLVSACAHVCHHPCEDHCARGTVDDPVALRELKRFALQQVDPATVAPEPMDDRGQGRRIAVVGAGPAGLAAAHDLALLGYRVTLLEIADRPGGMLEQAIPPFRLPRAPLRRDLAAILALGIELRCGVALGPDLTVDELRADGFERVIVATGLPRGAALPIEGNDLPGVLDGLDLLRRLVAGRAVDLGRRVTVVGGGDPAVDVARALARTTSEGRLPGEANPEGESAGREIQLVFRRRTLAERARREEGAAAAQEGIRTLGAVIPRRIVDRGAARFLEVSTVATYRDARGRYRPRPRPGTRRQLPTDALAVAVGRRPAPASHPGPGAKLAGGLEAGDGWLAGGDLVGAGSVVSALAAGRAMAAHTDQQLSGGAPPARIYVSLRGTDRTAFAERGDPQDITTADVPLAVARARREGDRCLDCFGRILHDSRIAECTGCARCVSGCPGNALRLVTADGDGRDPGARSVSKGSVLLLVDDGRCLRCGICGERCPVGCLDTLVLAEVGAAHG